MTATKRLFLSAALALTLGFGSVALAQNPVPNPAAASADALTDPSMKGPEVIAFIGIKPGDKIADIVAGRFTRALSQAVGKDGKLYAYEPDEIIKLHPEILTMLKPAAAAPGSNVTLLQSPINKPNLPSGLDAVFIRQNYHDLYDKMMGPADVPAFNKAVFDALKPGGVYVVLDHDDAVGAGLSGTEPRHRIEKAAAIKDIEKAGFKLDGESKILANSTDDHTKMVLDPAIRGKTDQFLLKFRKPK